MCNYKFCTVRTLCSSYNTSLANPQNICGIVDIEKVVCSYGEGHYGRGERLFDYCNECGHSSYITNRNGLCKDCLALSLGCEI